MFDARKGQITITRGDTGLLAIVPTGYVPTSQDRMFFMVAEMPDGRIVINKTVTPDDDGVCKLMFSGTDTENLSKRHREYTYAIRFVLDVTESNGKITGYREMITPEPPGCFVVLEANGCPACTCETQNVGSMEVKLESFRGPKGDRGEKGDKGDTGKDAVIDATLTQEGAAADAAATGKRLAEIEKAVSEKADKARQNILIGTETGNPVSVSDAFSAPLCGLTVYGRSTQDGTPSPDNPVPIVSAGDGGAITMKVTGKNLYHATWTEHRSENGLLFTATSTTIAMKGTATKDTFFTQWLIHRDNPLPLDPNKRYTITPKITGTDYIGVMVYTYDEKGVGNYTASNIPERSTGIGVYYQKAFKKDETIDFETSIQLEIGTEATEYEPYREQLLVLQTPNGLPGIPVTSGGNYTDPQGQQWICDEIDLARGVRVQRIASFVIDAKNANHISVTNLYTHVTVAVNARISTPEKTIASSETVRVRNLFCEALPWIANAWARTVNSAGFVENGFVDFTVENSYLGLSETSTDDERKNALVKYFTDNPCQVVYGIATTIETPLTEAELTAYKALTTYAPNTVVQAADGAGLKLDYQRDVNIVIKNLEDAIASMTTT